MDSQTGDPKKLSILGLEKQAVGAGERTGQQWVLRGTARRGACDHMAEGRAFGGGYCLTLDRQPFTMVSLYSQTAKAERCPPQVPAPHL